MTLSDTQSLILSRASQHAWRLASAPKALPAAARHAVFRSLLKQGLLAECTAPVEYRGLAWRQDADGAWIALRITDAGLRAIEVDPAEGAVGADMAPEGAPEAAATQDDPALPAEASQGAPAVPDEDAPEEDNRPRHERLGIPDGLIYGSADEDNGGLHSMPDRAEDLALLDQTLAAQAAAAPRPASLRKAAVDVLAAWEDEAVRGMPRTATDIIAALAGPMARLRAALAGVKPARAPRDPAAPRKPRAGTKQEQVLALLRRPEGATVAQIAEATGWAPHTVRGFFAGLKKRQGIAVTVLERVRQVGPNREGAKGSYTVLYGCPPRDKGESAS